MANLYFSHLTAYRLLLFLIPFKWLHSIKVVFFFFQTINQLCIIIFLAVRLTQFIVFPSVVVIIVIIIIDISILLFC